MSEFKFILGIDYYLERGQVIMTESYLAKRGTCCGNICRHCCFWPIHTKGNKELKIKDRKNLDDSN